MVCLAFEDLQEQGELCYFNGLGVYINAVDVVEEYPFSLDCRKPPPAALGLIEGRFLARCPFLRCMFRIPVAVPVEEALIRADEKGTGAAGRVKDFQVYRLFRRLAFEQFTDCIFYDLIDDIAGRIENTASLFDLRFIFNGGAVSGREVDDLAKELLVDLSQDIGRQDREFIRAVRVIEIFNDLLECFVVKKDIQRQIVRRLRAVLFSPKIE